jgi:hypothetical protein
MTIYTAQVRYLSTRQVVFTVECDGASLPVYTFEDEYLDMEDGMRSMMETRYAQGLYGTGSVGQVRDALHAMHAVTDTFTNMEIIVPADTALKVEKEIKRDESQLGEGDVF